jgi:hypothetical protein
MKGTRDMVQGKGNKQQAASNKQASHERKDKQEAYPCALLYLASKFCFPKKTVEI